jgi:predicted ABC-type transport system involved in lysophospholipase L1 biosynthesis ATPase subunit
MKTRVIQDEPVDRPFENGSGLRPAAETVEAAAVSAPRTPVVSAQDLTRQYGANETAVHALRGVSVDVTRGALTAVMGPSGSGKSTLMHILAGLDQPTAGDVRIADIEIGRLNDTQLTKLRREHIGFIFQFFDLLPMLTARENIVLPLSIAGEKPDAAWIEELTTAVGLGDRLSHRPSELSGGQQQRVAVATPAGSAGSGCQSAERSSSRPQRIRMTSERWSPRGQARVPWAKSWSGAAPTSGWETPRSRRCSAPG